MSKGPSSELALSQRQGLSSVFPHLKSKARGSPRSLCSGPGFGVGRQQGPEADPRGFAGAAAGGGAETGAGLVRVAAKGAGLGSRPRSYSLHSAASSFHSEPRHYGFSSLHQRGAEGRALPRPARVLLAALVLAAPIGGSSYQADAARASLRGKVPRGSRGAASRRH